MAKVGSMQKSLLWWESVLGLVRAGKREDAFDALYDGVDAMLCEGRFDEVDDWIDGLDPADHDDEILVAIFIITLAAKHKIVHRALFLERARGVFLTRNPEEEVVEILWGLM